MTELTIALTVIGALLVAFGTAVLVWDHQRDAGVPLNG
jgi:hypothetical protein